MLEFTFIGTMQIGIFWMFVFWLHNVASVVCLSQVGKYELKVFSQWVDCTGKKYYKSSSICWAKRAIVLLVWRGPAPFLPSMASSTADGGPLCYLKLIFWWSLNVYLTHWPDRLLEYQEQNVTLLQECPANTSPHYQMLPFD